MGEMTGLLHGAWVIAAIIKKVTGVQRDEVYIGTAEERAKQSTTKDDSQFVHAEPGKIIAGNDVGDAEPPVVSFDADDKAEKTELELKDISDHAHVPPALYCRFGVIVRCGRYLWID